MKMTRRKEIPILEDLVILLLFLMSAVIFCATFFPAARLSVLLAHELEMKRATERLFSILFLIMSYHLIQRRRMAWAATLVLLMISLVQHLLMPVDTVDLILIGYYVFTILCLLAFARDFCCPSAKDALLKSLLIFIVAVAAILWNTGLSYHILKTEISGEPRSVLYLYSLSESFGILFGTTNNNAPGFPSVRFENFIFFFTWICILIAVLYLLRPFIIRHLWSEKAMQRARGIVLQYGQNPASYLTLEADKYLYFSKCAEGVVPYGIVGSTVIVNGDPVCEPGHFQEVLEEFRDYCVRSSHKLVFLSITDQYLKVYQACGFGTVKCGEEARFDLASYDIAGKKGAKMRMNINHASRSGLVVKEYKPLEKRDSEIEAAFDRITKEWLDGKKSSLLTFTMGSVGLENPMDRRYFYAVDEAGVIQGFHVFCPFACGRGYMADITRRSHQAPGGITEKINYEAFQVFKQEGYQYASLGIAPLANLCQDPEHVTAIEKILKFVYEHLNSCYGFKNLYQTKAAYSPTQWVPGYYAYLPKIPVPSMMYAMVRIQNKRGILDFFRKKG